MDIPSASSSSHQASRQLSQEIPFDFRADNKEYWLLELKNMLLTGCTLGLYGPWAAVKRRKYLAQHTYLDGANFEYTADPKVILRARIIVVAFYIALAVLGMIPFIGPIISLLGNLAIIALVPLAVRAAISFQAKNLVYRGARFSFQAEIKETYIWYFKTMLIFCLSLGLAMPLVLRSCAEFTTNRMKLGGKSFSFKPDVQPFMKVTIGYVMKGGACLLGMGVLSFLVNMTRSGGDPSVILGVLFGIAYFAVLLAFCWILFNTIAVVANMIFERTTFGEHSLESNQDGTSLFELMITNMLLVGCTFGLLAPVAVLRIHRYRYERLKVLANGPLLQGVSLDPVGGSRGGSDSLGSAMMDLEAAFDLG